VVETGRGESQTHYGTKRNASASGRKFENPNRGKEGEKSITIGDVFCGLKYVPDKLDKARESGNIGPTKQTV